MLSELWNNGNDHNRQSLSICLFFCHVAPGIFVPWLGIKPVPPALKVQSPNHWIVREVPVFKYLWILGIWSFLLVSPLKYDL